MALAMTERCFAGEPIMERKRTEPFKRWESVVNGAKSPQGMTVHDQQRAKSNKDGVFLGPRFASRKHGAPGPALRRHGAPGGKLTFEAALSYHVAPSKYRKLFDLGRQSATD